MWLVLALISPASATWSVVATDSATGEVGGAGTSCVGSLDVAIIFAAAPGVGAVHAQAQINTGGRDRAAQILSGGGTPQDAIDAITDPSFDAFAALRQYGVVDLSGNAAGYTGSANGDWAGDVQGTDGSYTYSVQGNILTGAPVVDRTAAAFVDPQYCDLADRLMAGLQAGGAPGEGDSRCTPDLPSDSAFIQVVDVTGAPIIELSVTDTSPADPLVALRAEFDQWRVSNPCPATTPTETGDTGGADTGDTGTPTDPPTDTPTDGATDAATDDPDPAKESSGGCGCSTSAPAPGAVVWLLSMLGAARIRRVQRASTEV